MSRSETCMDAIVLAAVVLVAFEDAYTTVFPHPEMLHVNIFICRVEENK